MKEYIGLTTKQAQDLLQSHGPNILKEEPPKTVLQMFIEQMLTWTNFILAAAVIISIVLKDYGEAAIIGAIVIINGIIGVVQEGKAQKALEALKKMTVLKATVIRDGEKKEISSEELVPGDIVSLEAGQQVPADIKLLETSNLKIDEKALTGESVAVEKDASFEIGDVIKISLGDQLNKAFMSTIVTYGRGIGIVEKTGMDTEIGKIADMVGKEKDKPSPLQKAMDELSGILGVICVVICILMFIIGMFQGRELIDMLMTSVSLAVAAIPEGIPTVVTIILALGMRKMADNNAIVKSLPAVETLGAVSYVCSDKTGTLTQNKMTVVKAWSEGEDINLENPNKERIEPLIHGFLLCTDAVIRADGTEIGDPTETALVRLAQNHGYDKKKLEKKLPRVNEYPFDSERKLMTTVHRCKNRSVSFTKGSTDEIIQRCSHIMIADEVRKITNQDKQMIIAKMSEMSNEALRVLSLAMKYDNLYAKEEDLIYIGMVGMIDPERPEVIESIQTFKKAGVKTIMITGDHKDTALAIAQKLGIAETKDEVIMGAELEEMSDEELKKKAPNLSIFARVSPEHKVRIVKAFQDNGNIVSMTGDGVNDAPSLKAANVGVAMGITGTDVAKGAADIILQDDKFTTIQKTIKEGRNIYENLKKSIYFSVSSNISEIIMMVVAICAGLAAPLKAVHILWVNLLTDSLPCFALGVDPNSSSDVMNKPPRKEGESIFANGGIQIVAIYSIICALVVLGAFLFLPIQYLLETGQSLTLANIGACYETSEMLLMKSQTYAFTVMAIMELFQAIGMRDSNTSIFKFNLFDNKVMLLAILVGFVGQILVTEIPFLTGIFGTVALSLLEWIVIIIVASTPLWVHEILVLVNRKKTS